MLTASVPWKATSTGHAGYRTERDPALVLDPHVLADTRMLAGTPGSDKHTRITPARSRTPAPGDISTVVLPTSTRLVDKPRHHHPTTTLLDAPIRHHRLTRDVINEYR